MGLRVDQRTDIDGRMKRITQTEFGSCAGEHRDELIGDVVLHKQHAQRRATLPGTLKRGLHNVANTGFEQRGRIDDHCIDAASLGHQRGLRITGGQATVDLLRGCG